MLRICAYSWQKLLLYNIIKIYYLLSKIKYLMGKLLSKQKKPLPPKLPTAIEIRTWIGGAQAKMSLYRSKKVNDIRAKKVSDQWFIVPSVGKK